MFTDAIRSADKCEMVAREGIEPPTRGFSVAWRVFQGNINQSLTALATPLPRHTKAQSWHTKFELGTFLAQATGTVPTEEFLS